MQGTREPIYQALFSLVSNSSEYKTKSRKLKLWGDTLVGDRPAIFMHQLDEDSVTMDGNIGTPNLVTLHVNFFIYTAARSAPVPAAILNPLLDAIETVLKPDNTMLNKQTLGGLVDNCWISGKTFFDAGDLDGDGLAIVPVSIFVP
jgi:hypothetical protein